MVTKDQNKIMGRDCILYKISGPDLECYLAEFTDSTLFSVTKMNESFRRTAFSRGHSFSCTGFCEIVSCSSPCIDYECRKIYLRGQSRRYDDYIYYDKPFSGMSLIPKIVGSLDNFAENYSKVTDMTLSGNVNKDGW